MKYSLDPEHKDDYLLVTRFFKKYPEVKYMPLTGPLYTGSDGAKKFAHPASHFVFKQKKLMNQGYSENVAFQMVEKELAEII